MSDVERVQTFVEYANTLSGDEKGEAQVFCDRLFIGFGHDGYKEAGATLEQRVKNQKGTTSFADLMWSPRLLLEMKKRGEKLQRHYQQAFEYWLNAVPNRPRYVVLCNFDEFWVYDFDKQLNDPIDMIGLNELTERYTALNFLFPDERRPLFGNDRVAVTREAANKVAKVFNAIVTRGEDREVAQRFVLQCVTAMFAEDIDLLPRGIFAQLLQDCVEGASTYDLLGGLFRQMNDAQPARGGRYKDVPYFNGGLFSVTSPIELAPEEIILLREATDENWAKVQPPVFGTLFQDSMDKEERHAFGAHFTHEADIQRVVNPTIVRPWRERIHNATTLKQLLELREELSRFHVLDPACGSGNFLYVAYRELKHLEFELLTRIHEDFKTGWEKVKSGSVISLRQFHGLDVVPFAVELAKLTLTIGKKLAIDEARASIDAAQMEMDLEHGFERTLPLENLDEQIRCDDALFCEWPVVNAIIGNPPFQSKNKMQQEYGHEYVARIREKYPEIPGRADYCVYWFRKAHDELGDFDRAGLVGTNTIRQNYSREGGLDYIVANNGTIVDAVSTQEWSGDAAVDVSIVNWVKGPVDGPKQLLVQTTDAPGKPWSSYTLDRISAALSPEVDVTGAAQIAVNKATKTCFQGQTHGHEAFLLDATEAERIDPDGNCVHPYVTGDEVLTMQDGNPSRFVIDLNSCPDLPAAMAHGPALERLRELALPDLTEKAEKEKSTTGRATGPRQNHMRRWWRFWRPRDEMVARLEGLSRFIVCARVTKRPIFAFVKSGVRPNDALQVFAFEDDYSFGILQSREHWAWFVAKCSTLTGRYRYTPNSVFDTFPWPQGPSMADAKKVAKAARELRQTRRTLMSANGWNLRDLYRSLESPGDHPLKDAQIALDDAVRRAYGRKARVDALQFLLDLNWEVVSREAAKEKMVGPGLLALGGNFADAYETFVSKDYVVGA
tara:strand:+ start:7306 stop:10161 length:2856 start_codon:yes stop_codon:yes gene_type:complete